MTIRPPDETLETALARLAHAPRQCRALARRTDPERAAALRLLAATIERVVDNRRYRARSRNESRKW